ncbi:MAG: hypothetical protein ACP5M4_07105 [Acidobacteriaceae bacterium]
MMPMLAWAVQIVLLIVGLLFIGAGIFAFHSAPTTPGFFASIEAQLKPLLFLFIGFLCFLGAHRVAKAKSKKPSPPPPPTPTPRG